MRVEKMAATESTMLALGTVAPAFELLDTVSGKTVTLASLSGVRGTLIVFMCNHCPYVLHVKSQLIAIARDYAGQGIATIAISPNDVMAYPQDGPDEMKALMQEWGNPFAAYCYDETQAVAKAYRAVCTPDNYVFDAELRCVYRGRLDGASPKNTVPVTGESMRAALDDVVAGRPVAVEQVPSIGCSIKWKADAE
jgi:thiol-disulfide isomerase/thioredoxin